MKITIVGLGYVGLSNALLLAQNNQVIGVDVDEEKIEKLKLRISPLKDKYIEDYLSQKSLNLEFTTNFEDAVDGSDMIIVATPTNYDIVNESFDVSTVEGVIEDITKINTTCTIIIKSTVPIGFSEILNDKYINEVFFSPEFLREGNALYDNLYPSRIIVGSKSRSAKIFGEMLKKNALKNDVEVLYVGSSEAETIKLFSNTYLAMRVAFFNELDSFAEIKGLNSAEIIPGVSRDPRIGDFYNNPSFGYGGYCLPKDTKQLLTNFSGVPQNIIKAIIDSNETRKMHIVKSIYVKGYRKIGFYKLAMKSGSDNFRESSIVDIIREFSNFDDVDVYIFEPNLDGDSLFGGKIIKSFSEFEKIVDVIVTNRVDSKLNDTDVDVYSRDIFSRD